MTIKTRRGKPRRSISSTKRRRGQKVRSVIQNYVPISSIDKDMHCECTGQMRAKKYLRKSCYHHIECSAANSLTVFM